jgi:D-3-phosphoglycerate dehydrogenase
MTGQRREPFKLWSERPLPARYARLLDGAAVVVGNGADSRWPGLDQAEGVIASARIAYDDELLARAPRLRVIARTGIGLDNIAVDAASRRGIVVCNVPDGPTISAAEHTIALLLAVAKRLKACDRAMRLGEGDLFSTYAGVELYGLRLGILGIGQIGGRVAALGRAFGMDVDAYDPLVSPERAAALGVTLATSLETLLQESDAVSLHLPLTPQTRHLMDARRFALMKPRALFVNTARGGLVDENALLAALEGGQIAGAGLDVFEREPPAADHPLLSREDVVATPHIAAATEASRDRLWRSAITQALQVLRGEHPSHAVNALPGDASG